MKGLIPIGNLGGKSASCCLQLHQKISSPRKKNNSNNRFLKLCIFRTIKDESEIAVEHHAGAPSVRAGTSQSGRTLEKLIARRSPNRNGPLQAKCVAHKVSATLLLFFFPKCARQKALMRIGVPLLCPAIPIYSLTLAKKKLKKKKDCSIFCQLEALAIT